MTVFYKRSKNSSTSFMVTSQNISAADSKACLVLFSIGVKVYSKAASQNKFQIRGPTKVLSFNLASFLPPSFIFKDKNRKNYTVGICSLGNQRTVVGRGETTTLQRKTKFIYLNYIIYNKKYIITNVTTLNKFNLESDYRLVKAKVIINSKNKTKVKLVNY